MFLSIDEPYYEMPQSYSARGFLQDGLLSHRFLRRYSSWTLDFDSRTFLFER